MQMFHAKDNRLGKRINNKQLNILFTKIFLNQKIK